MVGFITVAALAVSSQITDVTVYNDRAQVVRTADVELVQGINKLRFEDLPEGVDSRGIQVDGTGVATVLDVRFMTENFKEIPQEEWKELYDRRDELQENVKSVGQQIERLRQAKAFLSKISDKVTHQSERESEPELNPDSWDEMLTLYTAKNAEYDVGIQQAEQELKGIREDLDKVQADIRDAGADTRKQLRNVEVDLDATKPGKALIRLSYIVRGPRWNPTYDIRVDTKSRQMEVKYFALVVQNTGEDWSDVALRLSTANPSLGGQHPDLEPWRIDVRQPRLAEDVSSFGVAPGSIEMGQRVAAPMMNNMVVSSYNAMPTPAIEVRKTNVARQGVSVLFEVKGTSSIDADNVEHRVAVSSVTLPSHFRYSAVPKMDQHAYLKAKAVNQGESPFLPGKANVFLDDSYVASSKLDLVAPDEEFWVFLGADESMKVEYKLVKRFDSREGLTGKTRRHSYEYLMSVQNTHATPEEVVVWDQLPISGNEDIEVVLREPKYSKDTDTLKMDESKRIEWFQNLEPGQKWEIPFSFYVEAPKDLEISGLE